MRASLPRGVQVPALRISPVTVERCMAIACQRLGVRLPVEYDWPTVHHVPGLRVLYPGLAEATYVRQGMVLTTIPRDPWICHGLGHWLAEVVHGVPPGPRSEAWARLAEGRPLARLRAWWRGGAP